MSAKRPVKRLPSPDEPRPDYHRLPTSPPPETWHTTQDVTLVAPSPPRFAYDDDSELLLRFGWG